MNEVDAIVARLRADMGGHANLQSRIAQEVLRLRLEGQEELATALQHHIDEGNGQ